MAGYNRERTSGYEVVTVHFGRDRVWSILTSLQDANRLILRMEDGRILSAENVDIASLNRNWPSPFPL